MTEPSIDEKEFEVLRFWYEEWVKSCKLIATFAFSAIGFSALVFNIKAGHKLPEEHVAFVRTGWLFLGCGGLLAGFGIFLAYGWMDAFLRERAPSLVGKVVRANPSQAFLKIGPIGWVINILALVMVLLGLGTIVWAALLLL